MYVVMCLRNNSVLKSSIHKLVSQKWFIFYISDSNENANKLLSQGCHFIDLYNRKFKHEHFKTKYETLDILHINS